MMHAVRYGMLFALAIFLWAMAEWLIGLHDRYIRYYEYLSYFFAIPSVYIIYRGIYDGVDWSDGRVGFRKAFERGLGITLVVMLLCPLVWYVFCTFINPAFLSNMERFSVENKGMQAALAAQRFSLPVYVLIASLSTTLVGIVISLVIAIIAAQQKR
ncbi:DUF4199 domain-containing protein [Parapedobacter koreensis]|uniref:DUF4199 domain-containing protein n=1 Tax=Parapedobacter koreensis TaxID=332977 RepID=A0A1H7RD14_9SPHI|nr:DUF4199 domain-containing protein [Parapedobacter koreensis]SEL58230.1 Protein of unknown function [Parapedobacter koreensis]